MDKTQAYKEEIKRVSKVFDIAIDAFTKHRPQNWSEKDFDQIISDLKKDKQRTENLDKKWQSLAGLKKYTIPALFHYFKIIDDTTSRYFWQQIKEEQLPYKKETIRVYFQTETIVTDGNLVQAVYGSKNEDFLQIIAYNPYKNYDFFLEDFFDLSTNELSGENLMRNIIYGETHKSYEHLIIHPDLTYAAQMELAGVYAYIHKAICLHYGKAINRNEDQTPMFQFFLDIMEPRYRPFFDLPATNGFPHITHIKNNELEEYENQYKKRIQEQKFFRAIDKALNDLKFTFQQARKTGLDILFIND